MRNLYGLAGVGVIVCLCCVAAQARAEEASTTEASLEFILPAVQDAFSIYVRPAGPSGELVFKKEPAYAGDTVYRNALRLGDAPSDFIGMAYDVAAHTLYIDHNRNLDLTDDGPGITAEDGAGQGYARFLNVAIELTHEGVPVHYILDINFYGDYINAFVRSGWKGEFEIAGTQCVLGIADNMDGVFDFSDAFLFEHEKHRDVRLPYGQANELPLPKWLYFEGQSYHIESALRVVDGETALAVTLTSITEDLMSIDFEGAFVSRVFLLGRANNVGKMLMLDFPEPTMRIPQGEYIFQRVDLLDSFRGYVRGENKLESGDNALLKTGGPVKQKVTAYRSGNRLRLDYALQGVDGVAYQPDSLYQNHAQFAIYQGERKILTDNFEYG